MFDAKSLGVPGRDILEFNVALQDGVLQFGLGNGPKDPITPLSETSFTSGGSRIEFGKDDNGAVVYIVLEAVEGKFRANRKK